MRNNIIQSLKKILNPCIEQQNVDFLWLTGSFARGQTSNNIDIIAGVSVLNSKRIKAISEKISLSKEVIEKPEIFDDALRFRIHNQKIISLGLYKTKDIFLRLRNYSRGKFVNGEKRPWALNSWIPESFCADIHDSIVLYDKNGSLEKAKKMLNPYPFALTNSIIEISLQEIEQKRQKLDSNILAEKILAVADLISCITRMVFAKKQVYFSGYKNILDQLSRLGGKKPKKLIELWKKHKSIKIEIVVLKGLLKEMKS